MKKILMLAAAVIFASSIALAQGGKEMIGPRPDPKQMQQMRKEMEKSREEMQKNRKELAGLGEKYRKETNAAKKAEIEKQIETKSGNIYDKNIADMKKRTTQARERLADMDKKLDEAQKPEARAKHIKEISRRVMEGKTDKKDDKKGFKNRDKKDKKGKKSCDKK